MNELHIDRIAVRFGKVQALAGVSLSIHAGETLLWTSPNGAGKSTLLGVWLGLISPRNGQLRVDQEKHALKVNSTFKKGLGYLPEAVSFSRNLSGRMVLRFYASARGVQPQRVEHLLERMGLTNAATRAVRTYSRGMLQRLGLAAAIIAEPQLLILDEPTSGLDQQGLEVLWSVLREWHTAGRMVVIASHELALLERHIHRVCLLAEGKVQSLGTVMELRKLAGLPRTLLFDLIQEDRTAQQELLLRSTSALGAQQVGDALRFVAVNGSMLKLLALSSSIPGIRDIRIEEPAFNEVYEALLTHGQTRQEANDNV